MTSRQDNWWLVLPALACLVIAGCGGVEGKVVQKGQVVGEGAVIAEEEYDEDYNYLEIGFTPVDEAGNIDRNRASFSQSCTPDGSFEIYGDMGDGMDAGRYMVTVARMVENGNPGDDEDETTDMWKGKYGKENSKLIIDVDGGNLTVNLSDIAGG